MGDFAKVLYEKFFMRDFLGKLGPGAVVIVIAGYILNGKVLDLSTIPESVLWVAGIPVAYLTGLGIQIMSELLGLHSASPAPRFILFVKTKFSANQEFGRRMSLIGKATDEQWPINAKEQRERFVVLKEASGNMSMAFLIGLVLAWIRLGETDLGIFYKVVWIVFIAVLYLSHRIHAIRQANYETNVLAEVGLLNKDEADKMRRGKWLT